MLSCYHLYVMHILIYNIYLRIPLSRIYYMVNPTGGDSVRLPWQNPVPNSFNIGSQFKATSISQRSVFITGKIKMTLKTSVITSLKLAWEKTITTGNVTMTHHHFKHDHCMITYNYS